MGMVQRETHWSTAELNPPDRSGRSAFILGARIHDQKWQVSPRRKFSKLAAGVSDAVDFEVRIGEKSDTQGFAGQVADQIGSAFI